MTVTFKSHSCDLNPTIVVMQAQRAFYRFGNQIEISRAAESFESDP